MFEIRELNLKGAYILQSKVFRDNRGEFLKTFHKDFFEAHKLETTFAESFYTSSGRGVIRGMHYQIPPFDHVKLVYCLAGQAQDVLLDLRQSSPTYGQCVEINISGNDGQVIYIPKGFAHGFQSKVDNTIIAYSVSTCHEPKADKGILWSSINYNWEIQNPILSERDRKFPSFKDISSPFPEY